MSLHRLAAQDIALSRLQHGFEFHWRCLLIREYSVVNTPFFIPAASAAGRNDRPTESTVVGPVGRSLGNKTASNRTVPRLTRAPHGLPVYPLTLLCPGRCETCWGQPSDSIPSHPEADPGVSFGFRCRGGRLLRNRPVIEAPINGEAVL